MQAEMVKGLKERHKEFLEQIRVLEKDIQGHKKEIRWVSSRDVAS
jgi:hypothetical protein